VIGRKKAEPSEGAGQVPVIVYSRPGCPYCFLLRHGLASAVRGHTALIADGSVG